MTARFEVVRTRARQPWHARFRAANGRIVWTTEQYARRDAAVSAVHQIAKPVPSTPWEHGVMVEQRGAVEVRDVDGRIVLTPPSIEWPVLHTTTLRGEDYWHDRDTHWRHCFDSDCTEAVPPVGVDVRCRLGTVRVTKALLKEASHG